MNINFNEVTYEKLKFLATAEGKSVAAFVAQLMDDFTGQQVNIQFTMNEVPAGSEIIKRSTGPSFERHMDRNTDFASSVPTSPSHDWK